MSGDELPVVAIAGATGFVGQALRMALLGTYRVVGLTRSPTRAAMPDADGVHWRHCDLFSMQAVNDALEGVDYAIYLVHSMLPSARLDQANFVDLDLLLADNFARAAEHHGVKQILYIGGIQPRDGRLSRHLESRLEVERTLGGRNTPVTALRAGVILGPGGSSMTMMVNLVRRLPVMILPSWTRSASSPIAIEDVVRATTHCLGRSETFGQHYEIGGPEVMTYREMLVRTARVLGKSSVMVGIPVFSASLSRRWISWVTGAKVALVGPLIESLRHSMIPEPNDLQAWLKEDAVRFDDALARSLDAEGRALPNPRRTILPADQKTLRDLRTVRSVQRLPRPDRRDATWVADEYIRWLPRFTRPFVGVALVESGAIQLYLRGFGLQLLELTPAPERSDKDRFLFRITGGWLARVGGKVKGRLEFREVLGRQHIIAAIHDFRPTLPWYIYNYTQALLHLLVMRFFGRHLRRLSTAPPDPNE